MEAAKKEVEIEGESVVREGWTPEAFERWWARSEELVSILRRLPGRIVAATDMANRRLTLLDVHDELERPGLAAEIDDGAVGALRSWIKDAETLIHYIVTARDTGIGSRSTTASNDPPPVSGNNLPSAPRLSPIDELDDSPAFSDDWHWPWIEGWDDPKKRKAILHGKEKKKMTKKRKMFLGALAVGAVYAGAKYLDG